MNEDERPCKLHLVSDRDKHTYHPRGPSCRQPISSPKLFTLEAFNSPESSGKGKRRASARPFEFTTDGMDVDESDSDDDFIVPDDEDDHKPLQGKKRAKRNVVLSDDDDEYDDVIISAAKPEAKPKRSVGEMNENEISTKMQVRTHLPRAVASNTHPFLEDDGRINRLKEVQPRPEGIIHLLHIFPSLTPIQLDRCHLPMDKLPQHGLSVLDQRRIRACEVSRIHVS